MRNIINSGFQDQFGVARSGGKNYEDIVDYDVFAMTAIASINNLPDTIMDRGIKISMVRKLDSEKVESFRERVMQSKFEVLKRKCRKLMLDIGHQAGENIIQEPH